MIIKYTEPPSNVEGGSALPGCGPIHVSEVLPTLMKLSIELGFSVNLYDYIIGSAGKKEFSGDIDLVLDNIIWDKSINEFREFLVNLYGVSNVKRNADIVHLRYKIENFYVYTENRLGFVQIDFNFGNVEWKKFYHYSAGDKSEYKGAHRNLAIAAITSSANTIDSLDRDIYGRPINQIRWKWHPLGFMRLKLQSLPDPSSGVWLRKQKEIPMSAPIFDPKIISKILFPVDGSVSDLESLETIMSAIKRNYGFTDQEKIYIQIAKNFDIWAGSKKFSYPAEIDRYYGKNDK